jgi:serine/threonine-protein kinase RsbW
LESNPNEIRKLERALHRALHGTNVDETRYHDLLVSMTEAVNNAIIHGNKRDPDKKVHVNCELFPDKIVLRIKDEGNGFDMSSIPNPLEPENLMKASGRGILVIRTLMDSTEFNMSPHGTEVVLTMFLNKKSR